MLDIDDYIVVTKANNGYIVTLNNDTDPDEDRNAHVFNDVQDLLGHIQQTLEVDHASTQ